MFKNSISAVVFVSGAPVFSVVSVAEQPPTVSPTGFDTPGLEQNQGSQSVGNGIAQLPGDMFALDQDTFEADLDAGTGLESVFNIRKIWY